MGRLRNTGTDTRLASLMSMADPEVRRDIVLQSDPKIIQAVERKLQTTRKPPIPPTLPAGRLATGRLAPVGLIAAGVPPVRRAPTRSTSPKDVRKQERDVARFIVRTALVEPRTSDPNGFERILGQSDLLNVNFLTRGSRAAAAVCRLRVPTQGGDWFGTGFLVAPRLLMTNNHVLSSRQEASQAEAEFNYEHDADGVLNPPIQFNLAPDELFFTDIEHDVSFVAVAPLSEGGVPLERFGYLPLLPLSGKALDREWVTGIQHPNGQPKQMTIRACKVIQIDPEDFPSVPNHLIHYTVDTEPGSSGSPVLNDQWHVVAVHHKAIMKPPPKPSSRSQTAQNRRNPRPPKIRWLANEGVRISAVYSLLESMRFSDSDAASVLERLTRAIGILPPQTSPSRTIRDLSLEAEGKPLKEDHWNQDGLGYDPAFLRPVRLSLDTILGSQRAVAAKLKGSDSVILNYLHFSTVLRADRAFPMITAVNINGSKLRRPKRSSYPWRTDIRIEEKFQPGCDFYKEELGDDKITFDRGHLVRRIDPCWGDSLEEVELAQKHTFHYSNAAPQVHAYNDQDWGNLEDYVLARTQTLEKKVTVFSGPVYKDQDPLYGRNRKGGPWRIPTIFWKIAVIEKPGDTIAAAAFMIGQIQYLKALLEARIFTTLSPYTFAELQSPKIQTTIATIEEETGFDFSALRLFSAQDAFEATRQTRFLRDSTDIII